MMYSDLTNILVRPTTSIHKTAILINKNRKGIVLVVDDKKRLLGTITDGDIRRAILESINLDSPVSVIMRRKVELSFPTPITSTVGTESEILLKLMREHVVRQIPLLDDKGQVFGLATMDDLLSDVPQMQALIMAGGLGTRLRPLTEDLPKPMLKVGGKPLMEYIVEQLRQVGIRRVNVTTHYKPEKISDHFGDGSSFGVELNYVNEDRPLGTAGALGLIDTPTEPILVINGDILTQVDFRAMLAYHQEQRAVMTVAVRQYDIKVPYGVIECEGSRVCALKEKPQMHFLVNAGVYLLEPKVFEFIPNNGEHFNMTDLIQWLLASDQIVVGFPIIEYWLDIGQLADYEQAQNDMKQRGNRK